MAPTFGMALAAATLLCGNQDETSFIFFPSCDGSPSFLKEVRSDLRWHLQELEPRVYSQMFGLCLRKPSAELDEQVNIIIIVLFV